MRACHLRTFAWGTSLLLSFACSSSQDTSTASGGGAVDTGGTGGSAGSGGAVDTGGAGGSAGAGASSAREGKPCAQVDTLVCGDDSAGTQHNAALYCASGTYEKVFVCPGQQACDPIVNYDQIRCGGGTGTFFAKADAPCTNANSQACSFDQTTVLKCSTGIWVTAIHCSPITCQTLPQTNALCTGTWCNNCGFTIGDMCDFQAGKVICSTDLTKIVQCANGVITLYQDCGSQHCTIVAGTTISCS